jgi:hypothetical protein
LSSTQFFASECWIARFLPAELKTMRLFHILPRATALAYPVPQKLNQLDPSMVSLAIVSCPHVRTLSLVTRSLSSAYNLCMRSGRPSMSGRHSAIRSSARKSCCHPAFPFKSACPRSWLRSPTR